MTASAYALGTLFVWDAEEAVTGAAAFVRGRKVIRIMANDG